MPLVQPRITIVTPSFNQCEYLEQTIVSVLEQNYPDLEYIIIDGGSTDKSVEIIKKYEKYLSYWVSEKDNGQSHAINKGVARMTGSIFNWINSDDYLEKGALKTVAQLFAASPGIKCCIGQLNIVKGNRKRPSEKIVVLSDLEKNFIQGVIKQQSTFFSAEVIRDIGKLNEQLHFCMDLDLWYRFIISYGVKDVCMTDSILANFRMQDQSKSISSGKEFYNDRAAIFYSMLVKKNELKVSEYLKKEFNIPVGYFFDGNMESFPVSSVLKATAHFLLSDFGSIYTRHDFKKAVEIKSLLGAMPVSFENEDRRRLAKLEKETFGNSWTLFKVIRKLKWLLSRNT